MKPSFTMIEVVLAMAIIALVLGIGFFSASGSQFVSDVLRTETDMVVAKLREAQMSSMYGVAGADYRVRFDVDRIVVMPGDKVTILSGVTVFAVQLAGGGREVVFSHQFGAALPSGTVTLTGPRGQTRTIVISASGMIDWRKP